MSYTKDEELEIMQENIKHMRIQYLWPKRNSKYFRFKFFIVLILSLPLLSTTVLHFIAILQNVDILTDDSTEDIAVITSFIGGYQMVLSFVWQQKEIASLWKAVGSSKVFGKPDNFEKRRDQLNFLVKLFSYYIYSCIIFYTVVKIVDGSKCEKINKKQGLKEICGMITPAWAPFDISSTPKRQILFGFQFFTVYLFSKGSASVVASIFEVAEYIVLKIRHLRRLLREVFDDPREEMRRKNLIFCIKYHQHIIGLQELFNKRYKYINSCYIIMVGTIFGSVANQLMMERSIGPLLHLVAWLISFYICCYSGQSVLTESSKIPYAAFESKWQNASTNLQKDLLVLVVRAQRGFQLRAAPIGTMSFELFLAVVKTSCTYFIFLNLKI